MDRKNCRVYEGAQYWWVKSPEFGNLYIPKDSGWEFNGNRENPSFAPSAYQDFIMGPEGKKISRRVHFLIVDGYIEYLSDSPHPEEGKRLQAIVLTPEEMRKYYPQT